MTFSAVSGSTLLKDKTEQPPLVWMKPDGLATF